MGALRDNYPYTVKQLAELIDVESPAVRIALSEGRKIHGVAVKFVRNTPKSTIRIHRESYERIEAKLA